MGRKNNTRIQKYNYKRKMRVYNNRSKLFNGNVRSPGEFIFIWALIFAYIVGMWIFSMNLGLNKSDYAEAELSFEGIYRKNDSMVFTLSGKEYTVWASACDIDGALSLKEGDRLSVITAKDSLISAEFGGRALVDQTAVEKSDAEQKQTCSIFFGIFAALWAVFVGFSVWVMCNAHKLPLWLVKLFVKPSYINRPPR